MASKKTNLEWFKNVLAEDFKKENYMAFSGTHYEGEWVEGKDNGKYTKITRIEDIPFVNDDEKMYEFLMDTECVACDTDEYRDRH